MKIYVAKFQKSEDLGLTELKVFLFFIHKFLVFQFDKIKNVKINCIAINYYYMVRKSTFH